MRLPSSAQRAQETIAAALDGGITVFDTAHAYGPQLGTGERLLADSLRRCGAPETVRIVTKGGMRRDDGAWTPDGRAMTILADCEASLDALHGLPIDTYLLHAPDPRVPWRTSVRALARVAEQRLARRVGVSNVTLAQLEEARALAPVMAVEVALSIHDVKALRGGVLERCDELGIALIAHSPLGGPERARRLAARAPLAEIAAAHGVSAAEVALAWLLALSPQVVVIPGASRRDTVQTAARAAKLMLAADEKELLDHEFGRVHARAVPRPAVGGEVVIVMGIPGAGKTRVAQALATKGYVRLNRDERGGSLRAIASALDETLAGGTRNVVLDNTYLSRAARSYVLDVAHGHGVGVRCVWLDTPLAQAQVNLVERLLEQFGSLPNPELLREGARRAEGLLSPTSQMRTVRELEPPSSDEGFTRVDVVNFERARSAPGGAGVLVAAAALAAPGWEERIAGAAPRAPHLVFDWRPGASSVAELDTAVERLAGIVSGPIEAALCPHPAGPPTCWCRPPLPGLPLAFARAHGLELSRSIVIGASPAHRTLARALGAQYLAVA